MNDQKFKMPIPIPMGGMGDRELITVTNKKDRAHLNTIGKSRFSREDATDIALLLTIAPGDEGTIEFVENVCAGTFAEGGLSRSEQIMVKTGVVAPSSLSKGQGYNPTDEGKRRQLLKTRRKEQQDELGDPDA